MKGMQVWCVCSVKVCDPYLSASEVTQVSFLRLGAIQISVYLYLLHRLEDDRARG